MKETHVRGCTTPKVISQGLILHICSINGINAQLNTIHMLLNFVSYLILTIHNVANECHVSTLKSSPSFKVSYVRKCIRAAE